MCVSVELRWIYEKFILSPDPWTEFVAVHTSSFLAAIKYKRNNNGINAVMYESLIFCSDDKLWNETG